MAGRNNSQLLSSYLSDAFSPAFGIKQGVPNDQEFMKETWHPRDAWPMPHQRLRGLHHAGLMQWHWDRVMQLLREPVQTKKINGESRISQVLGTALFVHFKDGSLASYLWVHCGQDTMALRYSPFDITVTEIPHGFIWLDRLCELAKGHRKAWLDIQGEEVPEQDLSDYMAWMYAVFKSRIKRHCDMRAVRHKIRSQLGLNNDAWRIAHRAGLPWRKPGKVSLYTYNEVVADLSELRKIDQDCSAVLPVFAHLRSELRKDFGPQVLAQQPLKVLRSYLIQEGFEPRIWRLVLRNAGKIVKLANNFYKTSLGAAVLDVLRILQGLHVHDMPSPQVCQAIWGLYGNKYNRRSALFSTIQDSLPNLAHMVGLIQNKAPGTIDEGDLSLVVYYLTEPDVKYLDRRQRKLGWDYLVNKASALRKQMDKKLRVGGVVWTPTFDPEVYQGLHYKCLSSTNELIEVAQAMRNCLDTMTENFSYGDLLAVYVTTPEGKPVAVAQLSFTRPGWKLEIALGPMNRSLPLEVMDKIRGFTRYLSDTDVAASKLKLGGVTGRIRHYHRLYGNTAHIPFNHSTRMIMQSPISSDENFSRSVSISEFGALAPQFSVEFFSYLSTSKEPEKSQKNFEMILTRTEIQNLRDALDQAIESSDKRSALKALAQEKQLSGHEHSSTQT